jgi:alkaline phosphatase D
LKDAVIIWTRITTTEPEAEVAWEMSTQADFGEGSIVASGMVVTNADHDYTVKVDVSGLQSNTYYYYRFNHVGDFSIIGRTKTAPTADQVDQLRFATVSCSNWQHGYFNAYNRITDRNDIDAVIHLGDYIYEYGPGEFGNIRDHDPPKEAVELADYRTRYAQYRLDPALRNIHQQYPFITMWDDHESANNSYKDGAQNHQPATEGSWADRLSSSAQAYNEWLPIRLPEPGNTGKIYRSFSYGDLADIFVLDTRIIGRDKQLEFAEALIPIVANDPQRELLGTEQLSWLEDGLIQSEAKWKIIAQQVMVGPFRILGLVLNSDQWDGYGGERARLFDFIDENEIDNVVVLTGDIHSSWAMDLPLGSLPYQPGTGANSVGVEFVTTSVTSAGFPVGFVTGFIKRNNKHMKYVELTRHGYSILDLSPAKAQNDYYYTASPRDLNDFSVYRVSYLTEDTDNHLQQSFSPSESIYPPADPAPNRSGVASPEVLFSSVEITGLYPNPFTGNFVQVQYFLQDAQRIIIDLYDMSGRSVYHEDLGERGRGIYLQGINLPELASGNYSLVFRNGQQVTAQSLIKIEQ